MGLRTNFFIILLFGTVFFSSAQTVLKGVVQDSSGTRLSMINVVLQAFDSNAILAYCYSNTKGEYELEINKKGDFILGASGMGYAPNKIKIQVNAQSETVLVNDFKLLEKAFDLKEVILNADRPIVVKKDTISIKVNTFTNGSEEVVEDILKKLPGIEVTKDGTVKVQGKSVEKIMVEGDDLFEKGYKLLTKNLHAGVLDKVEILEHYSHNSLLKNIEDSDRVALNITLKEDQKSTLFGNIGLGYGTDQFYENKLNLISFNEKSKYYFFGNLNNIGSDAVDDIFQIVYPDFFTAQNYIGDGMTADNLINIGSYTPDINQNRIKFNNAELASLNGIFNPNKRLKIKGLVFLASDEIGLSRASFEEFALPPNNFRNNENYTQKKKSIAISGKWDFIYKLNKNAQIAYIGRYNSGNFRDKALLLFNDEAINELVNNETRYSDHRVTHTRRFSDNSAFQLTARYISDDRPQNYLVDAFLFQSLFPNLQNVLRVTQESHNTIDFMGLEGSYLIRKENSFVSIKAGMANTINKLQSDLIFEDDLQNQISTGDQFQNDFEATLRDLYTSASYKYTFKKFSVRSELALHQFSSRISSRGLVNRKSPLTLIPSLGLSWNINGKNKIITSYKYNTRNLPFNELYDGYTLTSYRNFNRGIGNFSQLKGSYFLASYLLGNWSDSFLINSSLIYNKNHDYVGRTSEVQSSFVLNNTTLLKDREFYSMNFTGDKLIDKLATNMKINVGVSKNRFQNIINDSGLRTIESDAYSYGGEFRSVFLGRFNFHLGSKWTTSLVKSSIDTKNTNNTTFLDLTFDIAPNLSLEIKNECYYFGNLPANKTTYFTDFDLRYNLKGDKLKLRFIVNNLFNNRTFSNFYVSDTGSYGTGFQLLPRYILIKLGYRF